MIGSEKARRLADSSVDRLCPNCGLCCNGVLFADVELRKNDDANKLSALGLVIGKKGLSKRAFAQPCSCYDGKLCAIYADRPKHCRAFECGLLKRVDAGELKAGAALKTIARAKTMAEKVRVLLRQAGENHEQLALLTRYSMAMSAPIDLTDSGDASEKRGKLMLAVGQLMELLQRDFLH